jgi:hypothetical protein
MEYTFDEGKIIINQVESREAFLTVINVLLDEYIPYVIKNIDKSCGNSILEIEIYFNNRHISQGFFWEKAIKYYCLDELSSIYLTKLIQISKEYKVIWLNEEESIARYVAVNLCEYSNKYIPLFNQYIEWHDMDHEVNEFADIDNIISKNKWCNGTLELIAIRAGISVGQNGIEQFENCVFEKGLRDYLREKHKLEEFIYNLFLSRYLEHYGYLMKKSLHWVWPLDYVYDSINEICEILIDDEEERNEIIKKCRSISEIYYESKI